jgi:hypothetical protein
MTLSCCSCHHAARTWPCWPPGPSHQAYLPAPHLESSSISTFRACSSHAPAPIKPQPTPAVLSQELVHTKLSIIHHTRKRPSTGPQTRQLLNLPLDVYIDNTSDWYPKRKENRKKRLKELQQVIESRKEWQRGRPLVEGKPRSPVDYLTCDHVACPPLQTFSAATTRGDQTTTLGGKTGPGGLTASLGSGSWTGMGGRTSSSNLWPRFCGSTE